MPERKTKVFIIGQKGYVFSTTEVSHLRKDLRIVGNMIGASKTPPGVGALPLELSPEEVTLLHKRGWAELVKGDQRFPQTTEHQVVHISEASQMPVRVPNLHPYSEGDILGAFDWEYPTTDEEKVRWTVFEDMYNKGYFLTGGAKFGGDWLAYPGDPIAYHAQFVIRVLVDGMPQTYFVSVAREAHAARKHLLMASALKGKHGALEPQYVTVAPASGFGQLQDSSDMQD